MKYSMIALSGLAASVAAQDLYVNNRVSSIKTTPINPN